MHRARESCRSRLQPVLRHWVAKEALASFTLAVPIAVSILLSQSIFTVSVAFTAHASAAADSAVAVDAVGLAASTIAVTARCTSSGLASALDTLAFQAWGARAFKKVGVYVQRAILIQSLAALLNLALLLNMESILHLIRQPPCVIEQTVQYIKVFSACLPAIFLVSVLQRYLQSQKAIYPIVIAGAVGNVINALAHYAFLSVAGWGVPGVAGAVAISWYTIAFTLLAIIYVRKLHRKSWDGWSRDSLNGWGQMLWFGLPGLVMLFVEWGSLELGIFLNGIFDTTQQTLYVLASNWIQALFPIPVSISIATSIRIGSELGAGKPKHAKRSLFIGICISFVFLAIDTIVNVSLRQYIPRLFSSDVDIISLSGTVMLATAALCFADHCQVLLAGAVRGLGKQAWGSIGNIIAYWGVGIPIGVGLLFGAKLGAVGFLSGFAVAGFAQLLAFGVITFTSNWQKQSEKARDRAGVQRSQPELETQHLEHTDADDSQESEDEMPLHPLDNVDNNNFHTSPSRNSTASEHVGKDWLNEVQEMNNNKMALESDEDISSEFGDIAGLKGDPDQSDGGLQKELLYDSETSIESDSESLLHSEHHSSNLSHAANGDVQISSKDDDVPTVTKKTVFLRIVTVLIVVAVSVTSIVFSQVYVYRGSGVCIEQNVTSESNVTGTPFNNSVPIA